MLMGTYFFVYISFLLKVFTITSNRGTPYCRMRKGAVWVPSSGAIQTHVSSFRASTVGVRVQRSAAETCQWNTVSPTQRRASNPEDTAPKEAAQPRLIFLDDGRHSFF